MGPRPVGVRVPPFAPTETPLSADRRRSQGHFLFGPFLRFLQRIAKYRIRSKSCEGKWGNAVRRPYAPPNISSIARSITSGLRWLYISKILGYWSAQVFRELLEAARSASLYETGLSSTAPVDPGHFLLSLTTSRSHPSQAACLHRHPHCGDPPHWGLLPLPVLSFAGGF